ncbi:MAG: Pr6Pr family membrane protein [Lachnospiraceae bacterium]|nr:Pr6Pr family membrane protein [Lachnospiraceae bacterium]
MKNLSVPQKICSYILKTVTVLSALIGTFLSYYAGRLSFMGGSRVFMFFTIQSNIAIAVICAIGCVMMLRGRDAGKVWPVIKFVGTISITLTGVVFGFVLAPTLGGQAWNIQNTLTHLVVPVAAVLDFFVVSTAFEIKKRNDLFVIIPPILYAVYAGIGYVRGWQFIEGINYPYFFLNWGSPAGAFGFSNELPFMGTAWWIVALLFFLLAIGYIYLLIADGIRRIGKKAA